MKACFRRSPLRFRRSRLGPGLITGVADDDPSGIVTFAQAGAQFGFSMLWVILFLYPVITTIQEISACIGATTGTGVAGNLHKRTPVWFIRILLLLLFLANSLNIGADLVAMGDGLALIVGGPGAAYAIGFAIVSVFAEVMIPYALYCRILKWLSLCLLSYFFTLFFVPLPIEEILRSFLPPKLEYNREYLQMILALFGTTVSPYLLFWQSSLEAQEGACDPLRKPLIKAPEQALKQFSRIHFDTMVGIAVANGIAFFIILTTAATLHQWGVRQIDTATQAARALEPLAGRGCSILFSFGVIANGLLAVPVLAGSGAFAIGEALRWPTGLQKTFQEARGFYLILIFSIVIGLLLIIFKVNPMRALVFTALVNGMISAPILIPTFLMAFDPKVMGAIRLPLRIRVIGAFAIVLVLSILGIYIIVELLN